MPPAISAADLLALDQRHVWHPYAAMPSDSPSRHVVSADGVHLRLVDGRELLDGMASWWCAIHGYANPAIDVAVRAQLDRMAHVMFGGLTHEPAVHLATALADMAPGELEHVFFADSGSVAVEVAVKMCLQAMPGRRRLLTVRGGYHGDTLGAMALSDPVDGMHSLFAGVLTEHVFADRPPRDLDADYVARLEDLVARHHAELAAVIVEPVVQGAGGMWFYDPALLRVLRELCDSRGLLLVFDEIATGFGRTGALFACEHAGVSPDIMCVGKGLTGGYVTLAATLCTPSVAAAITQDGARPLMHGPTYMANPLACTAALASLHLLASGDWKADVARIEGALRRALAPAWDLPAVADVRVLGAIGVVELRTNVDVAAATSAAIECGVWLRPFRNLIYTMPPYITNDDEVERIGEAILAAAQAGGGG